MKISAALLTVSCLAAAFSLAAAAGGTPTSYAGQSGVARAVLAVMPLGAGRLQLRFTAAGAAVRREAASAHGLEAFCLWTIPGANEGLGMTTAPVAGRLLRSAAVSVPLAVSFHPVPRYTCGLHVHHVGEEPSASFLRDSLLAVTVKPAH